MRWGRVEITPGALLLWAILYYLDSGFTVPLAMAACALHELGHYAAIRLLGGEVSLLRLSCVGAELRLSARRPLGPVRELAATLAGPVVNLGLALLCAGLGEGWYCFAGIHLALGCFNLLPIAPLDGGRALTCVLTLLGRGDCAQPVLRVLSLALCGGMLAGATVLWQAGQSNLTLLCLSGWLLQGVLPGNTR